MIHVGIVFGGQSPEHEVSVITSLQAAAVLDPEKYLPVPIYVSKNGRWYTGEDMFDISAYSDLDRLLERSHILRIKPRSDNRLTLQHSSKGGLLSRALPDIHLDILLLGLHGGAGENGGIQGLCEFINIPYTGSGVLASSLSMDKARSKEYCREKGIPVVRFKAIRESEWAGREDEIGAEIENEFGFPLIVKPLKLGSSIGISLVSSINDYDAAMEEAFRYDETVIVEHAVENLREINCSVLGSEDSAVASVLEEPVLDSSLLSYEEKYMQGTDPGVSKNTRSASKAVPASGMASSGRIIPAPLNAEKTEEIKKLSVLIFQTLGCAGVSRIDFLMNAESGEIFFNEINTIPGSFSFYLWEPSGVSFRELVQQLIEIGFERHRQRVNRIRSYDVNLLAEQSARGLKRTKG